MVLTEPLPLMNAAANGVYPNAKTLLDVKFIYHFGDKTVTKQFKTSTYLYEGFISNNNNNNNNLYFPFYVTTM